MAARTCAGSIAWTLASLNSNLNEGAPPFSAAVRRADMDSPYKPEWREAQWQTALVARSAQSGGRLVHLP